MDNLLFTIPYQLPVSIFLLGTGLANETEAGRNDQEENAVNETEPSDGSETSEASVESGIGSSDAT